MAAAAPIPPLTPSPSPSSTTSTSTAPITSPAPATSSIDIRAYRPLPLTAAQEGQVRDIYYKNVRSYCSNEIRDFAHCATGRTFSIPFTCRTQRLAMNSCMNLHATREEEDRAREEWFLRIPERRREREEREAWQAQEKRKHREWWGLDEEGRRIFKDGEDGGGEKG